MERGVEDKRRREERIVYTDHTQLSPPIGLLSTVPGRGEGRKRGGEVERWRGGEVEWWRGGGGGGLGRL